MLTTIRPVRSLGELTHALDVAGAQTDGATDHTDWRFVSHLERYPLDADLDLAGRDGQAGGDVDLPGARARTVAAPPVDAPGGPVLLLTDVTPSADLAAAATAAEERGCAGVVVETTPGSEPQDALAAAGFRRHCDYLSGTIR